MADRGRAAAFAPAEAERPVARSGWSAPTPRWAGIGIFILLLVAGLAYAKDFLMPVALAFMLAFVFSPLRRFMERWHCPPAISALLIVGSLVGVLGVGGSMVAAPASDWIASAPTIGRELNDKLRELKSAAEGVREAAKQVDQITGPAADGDVQEVVVKGEGMTTRFAATAPALLAQLVLMLVLLYFILASGDMIYEKIVYVLPTFRDKRLAVRIAHDIERRVSRYLFTITIINAGLGCAIGLAMWLLGMPEPLLFGVIAFVLNFIPYIGAVTGIGLAVVIGLVSLPHAGQALAAGGVYLGLTSLEGQFITPYFIGRSLKLNTVVLFLSVTLWAWLWSVVGMIVATPLLVSFRVLCEHIPALEGVGHFLSARGEEHETEEHVRTGLRRPEGQFARAAAAVRSQPDGDHVAGRDPFAGAGLGSHAGLAGEPRDGIDDRPARQLQPALHSVGRQHHRLAQQRGLCGDRRAGLAQPLVGVSQRRRGLRAAVVGEAEQRLLGLGDRLLRAQPLGRHLLLVAGDVGGEPLELEPPCLRRQPLVDQDARRDELLLDRGDLLVLERVLPVECGHLVLQRLHQPVQRRDLLEEGLAPHREKRALPPGHRLRHRRIGRRTVEIRRERQRRVVAQLGLQPRGFGQEVELPRLQHPDLAFRRDGIARQPHQPGVLQPVGAAGQRQRLHHPQPRLVGVGPGVLHVAEDEERPVGHDLDRRRAGRRTLRHRLQPGVDLGRQFPRGDPRHVDLAEERQCHGARAVDRVLAVEVGVLVDVDADAVLRAEPVLLRRGGTGGEEQQSEEKSCHSVPGNPATAARLPGDRLTNPERRPGSTSLAKRLSQERQHRLPHRRRLLVPALGLAEHGERGLGAGRRIGGPQRRQRRRGGVGRGQRVAIAEADELRPRRDQPGDDAVRGDPEQPRHRQVVPVAVVGAARHHRREVGEAAEMRHRRQPRLDGAEPVAERRPHREPVDADPRRVGGRVGREPVERRGELAQHLPRERAAPPLRRLGRSAFACAGAPAEARQIERQHPEPGPGQRRPRRPVERGAAVDRLGRADVVAAAMCMDVEDRRRRPSRFGLEQVALHPLARRVGEGDPRQRHAGPLRRPRLEKTQRVRADLEALAQPGAQDFVSAFGRSSRAGRLRTQVIALVQASPSAKRVLIYVPHLLPVYQPWVRQHAELLPGAVTALAGRQRSAATLDLGRVPNFALSDAAAGGIEGRLLLLSGRSPRLEAFVRGFRPDLIHAHFAPAATEIMDIAGRLGVPLVVSYHGWDARIGAGAPTLYERRHLHRRPRLFREAALVLAGSEWLRRAVVALGSDPATTEVHSLGIDRCLFDGRRSEPGGHRIAMIGRLVRSKGTHFALDALTLLRQRLPDAELDIIGGGPEQAALERTAAERRLPVRFHGAQGQAAARALLARSRVLCFPSTATENLPVETLGLVAAEAQAMGVPVVGARTGGIPEVVEDGVSGLLVPDASPPALAAALERLLTDEALHAAMSAAGQARVARRFDVRVNLQALACRYERLLAR